MLLLFAVPSPFPYPVPYISTPSSVCAPLKLRAASTRMSLRQRSSQILGVNDYLRLFTRVVPDLSDQSLYKGACGRVAVVGGCIEYTGAPYFAAMSSLFGGGELAHVFCAEDAAIPIKSYSPELIVHPGWGPMTQSAAKTLSSAHAVVLGPGLGRSDVAASVTEAVVAAAVHPDTQWPLVVDADALYFLANNPTLRDLLRTPLSSDRDPRIYLTPNARELARLCGATDVPNAAGLAGWFLGAEAPPSSSGRVVVVEKGVRDSIHSVEMGEANTVIVEEDGSRKRCGGQGDVLSGLIGLFAAWSRRWARGTEDSAVELGSVSAMYSSVAVAAAVTTRRAGLRAFRQSGRAMVASDMLHHLGPAFDMLETGNT